MRWEKVLNMDSLPPGARQTVTIGQQTLLLINHEGQIYATDRLCPHLKLPLRQGEITEDGAIVCPWHHSAFDLSSGDVKEWSPWPPGVGKVLGMVRRERALPVFPTRCEEGSIWVGLEDA